MVSQVFLASTPL
jgi:hypothetical protein